MEKEFSEQETELLLRLREIEAVRIGELTQLKDSSMSPVYVDLRTPLFSKPSILWEIGALFFKKIREGSDLKKRQCVIGIPEAGTPLAVATFLASGEPEISLAMLRSRPKDYGTQKKSLIIEEINLDWEYSLLDDVITTSDTKIDAIKLLEEEGINIKRVIVAFDRQQGGRKRLLNEGYNCESLFEILEVAEFYLAEEVITQEQYADVLDFIKTHQFI